jgi:hypothetical protein
LPYYIAVCTEPGVPGVKQLITGASGGISGHSPTGKRVSWTAIEIDRIKEG